MTSLLVSISINQGVYIAPLSSCIRPVSSPRDSAEVNPQGMCLDSSGRSPGNDFGKWEVLVSFKDLFPGCRFLNGAGENPRGISFP